MRVLGKGKRLKARKDKGQGFLKEFSSLFAENFRKEIRKSEMWDQMVSEFGEEKANELLKGIKADIKAGPGPDESGDSTEDI
jgi:hypothetical protein